MTPTPTPGATMKRPTHSHGLGWIPDLPDRRDLYFDAQISKPLPPTTDVRVLCPPMYDQGNLGSCTANATAAAIEFDHCKQGIGNWEPSRLFMYYQGRVAINTVNEDSGAEIRDVVKSVNKIGAPHESLWPYDIGEFTVNAPQPAYDDAVKHKSITYHRIVPALHHMQVCLAQGWPFVCGISVYDSFFGAPNGDVPDPLPSDPFAGGHAILIVGYDNSKHRFSFRNSWGTGWGNGGYGTISYAYLTNGDLSDDFWVIKVVV